MQGYSIKPSWCGAITMMQAEGVQRVGRVIWKLHPTFMFIRLVYHVLHMIATYVSSILDWLLIILG